ncbi:PaREP1 family protein [Sulfurisphaera javensis]|uniref:PaREP1 family protein n=1 Tax=Sulfurisphaera javensis TaxID=2049879 RepID=A0AAT9GTG5_9CREN
MPIRDERTYAKMSFNDFLVSYERLKKGELKLSAFRAYKAERRMLQSLAMKHNLHRNDTKCAVPKKEMLKVARELENLYQGIYLMTEKALELFDEWKNNNAKEEDIKNLLVMLPYEWLNIHLSKEEIKKIKELQDKLKS